MTQRLKITFLISVPVFIAHGVEEYLSGFYRIDSHARFVFGYFETLPTDQAIFLLFQIMLWLALIVLGLLIWSEKWLLRLMVIPGLIYVYELHHFFKALEVSGYYPGVLTAIAFPIIGFFYWQELLRNFQAT